MQDIRSRSDQGNYWWELRRCAYMEDFSKPKIIFSEIVREPSFVYDENHNFFAEATARIIVGEKLLYLLAILNSKLFFYTVKKFYGGGGLGESGIRMLHTFFQNFPCIVPNPDDERYLSDLAYQANGAKDSAERNRIADEIDRKIFEMYGLTDEEIACISAEASQ